MAPAAASDFLPIPPGNRWVYVHEVVDGAFVGDYAPDTLHVTVTPDSFERRGTDIRFNLHLPLDWNGTRLQARDAGVHAMRVDAVGNLQSRLLRQHLTEQRPDTAAFFADHPGWTPAAFTEHLARVRTDADADAVVYDLGFAPHDTPPLSPVQAFLMWYHFECRQRAVGGTAVRRMPGDALPPAFRAGAERAVLADRRRRDRAAPDGDVVALVGRGEGGAPLRPGSPCPAPTSASCRSRPRTCRSPPARSRRCR